MKALQEELLAAVDRAKRRLDLYTNTRKEGQMANRLKKFLCAPGKVARVALYRAGFIRGDEVRVRMFWGGKLRLPLWDEDAVIAYYTGSFGPAEVALVRYLVRTVDSSSVFYDIGSNFGLYSALAHFLGAKVHSFEPNPRTTTYIKRNAKGATVNTLALADREGTIPFYEVTVGRKIGMSSLFPDVVPQTETQQPQPMEVATTTLDTYVTSHTPPTVMKIDVMNADYLVLEGGRALLKEHAPTLALRLYHNPEALERTEKTLALLGEFGYKPFRIKPDGTLTPSEVLLGDIQFAATFIFTKP